MGDAAGDHFRIDRSRAGIPGRAACTTILLLVTLLALVSLGRIRGRAAVR
jgi:hypothetical protein